MAKHICGVETAPYEGSVLYTKLKVSGVDVFSGGQFMDHDGVKAIRVHDEWSGIYKKVLIEDNNIIGAVMFGETSDGTRLMQLIRQQTDVSGWEKTAILNENGGSGGTSSLSVTAAMNDDDIVCGCNGVSKGTICSAIRSEGLTSVEEVKNCTNASRSCGGCKPVMLNHKQQAASVRERSWTRVAALDELPAGTGKPSGTGMKRSPYSAS